MRVNKEWNTGGDWGHCDCRARKQACPARGRAVCLRPSRMGHAVLWPRMDVDRLMAEALVEARCARDTGEVPIGAIVELDGEIIGRGFNHPIGAIDPTAHAEMTAIRYAATRVGNYRLTGATL